MLAVCSLVKTVLFLCAGTKNITEGGDTYDPTQEVEEGGSAICVHPQLRSEFISSLDYVRICFKRSRGWGWRRQSYFGLWYAWGWGGSVCVSRNVKGLVMVEVDQAVEDRTGNSWLISLKPTVTHCPGPASRRFHSLPTQLH